MSEEDIRKKVLTALLTYGPLTMAEIYSEVNTCPLTMYFVVMDYIRWGYVTVNTGGDEAIYKISKYGVVAIESELQRNR